MSSKITKKRKIKKPEGIPSVSDDKDLNVYADFDDCPTNGSVVYIGGPFYEESAQIHLTKKDVLALASWIAKAAAYLKQNS